MQCYRNNRMKQISLNVTVVKNTDMSYVIEMLQMKDKLTTETLLHCVECRLKFCAR